MIVQPDERHCDDDSRPGDHDDERGPGGAVSGYHDQCGRPAVGGLGAAVGSRGRIGAGFCSWTARRNPGQKNFYG